MTNLQKQRPFSIKIFVPTGDPDGLRLIEKSNCTGVGVVFFATKDGVTLKKLQMETTKTAK